MHEPGDDPALSAYLADLSPEARAFHDMGSGLREQIAGPALGYDDRRVRDQRLKNGEAALFTAVSCNRKLAYVSSEKVPGSNFGLRMHARAPYIATTFVSIDVTCPTACPFKGEGCFADAGFTRIKSSRLDRNAQGLASLEVIEQEAREIDRAFNGGRVPQDGMNGGRDLRLHVGGDVGSEDGARLLARAASRWLARGGGRVFTYTHNWPTVPRSAFGQISTLASVERIEDIAQARAQGFAAAIVVDSFPRGRKMFRLAGADNDILPCPAELDEKMNCVRCRVCMDDDRLRRKGITIAFKAHGNREKHVVETLVQLRKSGPSPVVLPPPPDRDAELRTYTCTLCNRTGHNMRTCPNGAESADAILARHVEQGGATTDELVGTLTSFIDLQGPIARIAFRDYLEKQRAGAGSK